MKQFIKYNKKNYYSSKIKTFSIVDMLSHIIIKHIQLISILVTMIFYLHPYFFVDNYKAFGYSFKLTYSIDIRKCFKLNNLLLSLEFRFVKARTKLVIQLCINATFYDFCTIFFLFFSIINLKSKLLSLTHYFCCF